MNLQQSEYGPDGYKDAETLVYSGAEWEAAKEAFNTKWKDSGDISLDILFDDFFAGFHAGVMWIKRQEAL